MGKTQAQRDAEIAQQYLDIGPKGDGASFKDVAGGLRILLDKDNEGKGWVTQYLMPDQMRQLRRFLNTQFPPDSAYMTDTSSTPPEHPLVAQARRLCYAVERLAPSASQTEASVQASELRRALDTYFRPPEQDVVTDCRLIVTRTARDPKSGSPWDYTATVTGTYTGTVETASDSMAFIALVRCLTNAWRKFSHKKPVIAYLEDTGIPDGGVL